MKSIIIKTLILLFIIIVNSCIDKNNNIDNLKNRKETKIITLAPALTEIVYSLGLGNNIIGNTKFCNYPKGAEKIKKIGGYIDINIEIILKLKPDLIISYPEHKNKLKILNNRIDILEVKHISIADILNSIASIGTKLKKASGSENE